MTIDGGPERWRWVRSRRDRRCLGAFHMAARIRSAPSSGAAFRTAPRAPVSRTPSVFFLSFLMFFLRTGTLWVHTWVHTHVTRMHGATYGATHGAYMVIVGIVFGCLLLPTRQCGAPPAALWGRLLLVVLAGVKTPKNVKGSAFFECLAQLTRVYWCLLE